MTKLILIRHGSTRWTKEKRYQGTSDITLSNEGIKQAKKIATRLKKEKIDVVYTSKLKRATQTAQEIVKFHKVKLIKLKELNERGYGNWEGLTQKEVKQNYHDGYKKYEKDRYKTRPQKGQSLFDLKKRIEPIIKKIIKQNKEKTILIVAHNGSLRVILGILMKYSGKKIASLYLQPTSLTVINIKKGKAALRLMNCSKHNA